jgi:hypothetical protein
MLPTFIIIGAMKCGTSSLFRYLASNPNIVPCTRKESDFFATSANFEMGVAWYASLFIRRPGCTHGFEASPNYTKRHLSPDVAKRMYSILPNVKLIYLVRDPVERTVSHYLHNYAHGRESRTLRDVINCANSNYIYTSLYYFQIEAFLRYFSAEQMLLVESERLRSDPVTVLSEICAFADIAPEHDSRLLTRRFHESTAKKRRSALERALLDRTNNVHLRAGIRTLLAPFRQTIERPVLSSADRARIIDRVSDDVESLRRHSGLRFSSWSI